MKIDQKMVAALKSSFDLNTGFIKSAIELDKDFDLVFENFKNDNYYYLDDVYNKNDLLNFILNELKINKTINEFINGRKFKFTYNGFIMVD